MLFFFLNSLFLKMKLLLRRKDDPEMTLDWDLLGSHLPSSVLFTM